MATSHVEVDPDAVFELRKRTKLTQVEFAQRLLVTARTVSRWEQGVSRPSEIYLRQMRQLWGFALVGRKNGS